MIDLSCILVCCDSEVEKGNSVFHSIAAILSQDLPNFELIVMENSSIHRAKRVLELNRFVEDLNRNRRHPVEFKIVSYKKQLNVNIVRNRGANLAQSALLVFVEDDTIIQEVDSFSRIVQLAPSFDFGFGAKRLWTTLDWFQNHSDILLDQIKNRDYNDLSANSGKVHESYKDVSDNSFFDTIQGYTFIANFGFIKKTAFQKVKGFPIYSSIDMSDDCLMYRLFNNNFRFKSLNDQVVFHVSHFRVRKSNSKNWNRYFKELIKDGNYWCHTYNTIIPDFADTTIIEPLSACHYDDRLFDMYKEYQSSAPLNIAPDDPKLVRWRSSQSLTMLDFAVLLNELIHSRSIDQFISRSMADFDNLAMIVDLAVQHQLISVTPDGRILNAKIIEPKKIRKKVSSINLILDQSLNQFPCNADSRYRRAKFIMQRYPFLEYMRFAIIGDDDLLSLHFSMEELIIPIVIETDKKITQIIKVNNPYALVFEVDLLDESAFIELDIPTVNTFITDPPYTFHGALLFICRGLMLLQKNKRLKEFYVILNEHMMGRNFQKLQTALHRAGVILYRVIPNFSQYPLPQDYEEFHRAHAFLHDIQVNANVLKLSSSSNLYIFRTSEPNIDFLSRQIVYPDVYNHYAEI